MSNNTKTSIRFFDAREVRAIWDEDKVGLLNSSLSRGRFFLSCIFVPHSYKLYFYVIS